MSAGDLVNSLGKLESKLKQVKFTSYRRAEFLAGTLDIYLAVYGYVFSSFNSELSKLIADQDMELYGKTNKHFVDNLYRIVRDVLCYKPPITKDMFLTNRAFIEMKIIMCARILDLILVKCKELTSGQRRSASCKTRISTLSGRSRSNIGEITKSKNCIVVSDNTPEIPWRESTLPVSTHAPRVIRKIYVNHYDEQKKTKKQEEIAGNILKMFSSDKERMTSYTLGSQQTEKNVFHDCSGLGISKNPVSKCSLVSSTSKSRVILEKQEPPVNKVPVKIEMGPLPINGEFSDLSIFSNENSQYPPTRSVLQHNYYQQQQHSADVIRKTLSNKVRSDTSQVQVVLRADPDGEKQPADKNGNTKDEKQISDSVIEINHLSQNLTDCAEILFTLQQRNLERKSVNFLSKSKGQNKENLPMVSMLINHQQVREPLEEQCGQENIMSKPFIEDDHRKELDYCMAKMNLMECAIKSLESKLKKL